MPSQVDEECDQAARTAYYPWELEKAIRGFPDYYNHHRYHDSLPAMTAGLGQSNTGGCLFQKSLEGELEKRIDHRDDLPNEAGENIQIQCV